MNEMNMMLSILHLKTLFAQSSHPLGWWAMGSGSSITDVQVPGSAEGTTNTKPRKINLPSKQNG